MLCERWSELGLRSTWSFASGCDKVLQSQIEIVMISIPRQVDCEPLMVMSRCPREQSGGKNAKKIEEKRRERWHRRTLPLHFKSVAKRTRLENKKIRFFPIAISSSAPMIYFHFLQNEKLESEKKMFSHVLFFHRVALFDENRWIIIIRWIPTAASPRQTQSRDGGANLIMKMWRRFVLRSLFFRVCAPQTSHFPSARQPKV